MRFFRRVFCAAVRLSRGSDDRIDILSSGDCSVRPNGKEGDDVSIATVLCDGMERTDMSQKALAQRAGVTQSYISQICAGKKIPTIGTLNRLSECLDIPILDFFREEEGEPIVLTEEERRLVRLYRAMDSKGKAVLTGIVSSV